MLDSGSLQVADGSGIAPSRPMAFVAAVAIAAAVLLLRWTLNPLLEDQAPFLVLLIAPVIAAAWLGFGPGLVATVVCTIAAARHRERRFRDAIEAAPSDMILANAEGRIAFASERTSPAT